MNDFLEPAERVRIQNLLTHVLVSEAGETFFSFSYFMRNRQHNFTFKSRHLVSGYEIVMAEGFSATELPAMYDYVWLRNSKSDIYQLYKVLSSKRLYESPALFHATSYIIVHKSYMLVLIDFLSLGDFMKKYGAITEP